MVALVLIVVGGGIYHFLSKRQPAEAATFEQSPAAPSEGAATHPYAKHFELTGFRIYEDARRRPQIRFAVINHSDAELDSVPLRVVVTTTKAKPEDPPVVTLNVTTPRLAAHESQDVMSPLNTKLRAYELPDWQYLKAGFEIIGTP